MSQNTAPVAATVATSTTAQRLYNRTLIVSDLTVKTDKKGRAYANFRGGFKDKKTGADVKIFCQAFGRAYEELKDELVEGRTIKVYGAHEQREADEANGVQATRSFRVVGKSMPRAKNDNTLPGGEPVAAAA
ncbi:hypothetical protein [Microvirga tunisiensis]|uniref:Single-stranded DNA-binding protein n=1 Tax=Microvirga tunisiensis TaxID=2108360 RepID=A0A5N7MLK1_9HYPH|nr:hypothetical protein [Microvirga tunisiensis]MPR09301.1 hypothetical protein [Microvirga tunisiensis]MPR27510.1 hypothetical protein [Microvirga tunisiensis]